MIEGIDYCYIFPKEDNKSVHIKFLEGQYKGTVFKYGKVSFQEIDDQLHLQFGYDVIESDIMKPRELEKDETFKNYIGDLLVSIMSNNIDEELHDENRDNNYSESDLQ